MLRRLIATNGAPFDFGEVVGDDAAELIPLRRPLHEPVAIYAQNVEPVEAVVDANQVNSVCEGLRLKVGLRLAEWFKANGTATSQRVVVRTDAFSHVLVHLGK